MQMNTWPLLFEAAFFIFIPAKVFHGIILEFTLRYRMVNVQLQNIWRKEKLYDCAMYLVVLIMAAEKIHIEQFLELAKQYPVLDVRSPGEYKHAHIPGAYSLPLFTDEERKIVGTAYKQQSREQAIKIGLDFFGPKMRKMVEEVESIVVSHESGESPDC